MSGVPPDLHRNPHPIDVIPPSPAASPADLSHLSFGGDVPFWKPSWSDVWTHLGWRWLLFLPTLGLLALLILMPWHVEYLRILLVGGWKLLVFAVALSLGMAFDAMKKVVGLRKEPFCIHCGYELTGLPDGYTCPECGRQFWLKVIDEYRRDPNWFIRRYRMHGSIPQSDVPFSAGQVRRKKSRDGT